MPDEQVVPETVTPPTTEKSDKGAAPSNNTSFYDGKYKSQEEFEKAYKSLESKLGEQGEKIKQAEEFATYVQPIIELARTDSEVFDILDKKLRNDTKKTPEKADQLELRNATSDLLLARFETEHNIDKLPKEDAEKLRKDIGAKVLELTGQQLGNIDLRRLNNSLENAYQLVKPKSTSSESETDDGSIPSISSSPGKKESTLSNEEAAVAQGLGLTREEYLEGKKGLAKKYK